MLTNNEDVFSCTNENMQPRKNQQKILIHIMIKGKTNLKRANHNITSLRNLNNGYWRNEWKKPEWNSEKKLFALFVCLCAAPCPFGLVNLLWDTLYNVFKTDVYKSCTSYLKYKCRETWMKRNPWLYQSFRKFWWMLLWQMFGLIHTCLCI